MSKVIYGIEKIEEVLLLHEDYKTVHVDLITAFEVLKRTTFINVDFISYISNSLQKLNPASFSEFTLEDFKKYLKNQLTNYGNEGINNEDIELWKPKEIMSLLERFQRYEQRVDIHVENPKSKIIIFYASNENEFIIAKNILVNILNKFKDDCSGIQKIENMNSIFIEIQSSKNGDTFIIHNDIIKDVKIFLFFEKSRS